MSFVKIERQLADYRPEWTVPLGIAELYEAYTGAGLSESDWSGDRYFRLRTIKSQLDQGVLDNDLRYVD